MPSVTKKRVPITPASVGDEYDYVVGVDTHAATHSYAIVVAPTGALVGEQSFPTTPAGVARACDWIARRTGGDVTGVLIRRRHWLVRCDLGRGTRQGRLPGGRGAHAAP